MYAVVIVLFLLLFMKGTNFGQLSHVHIQWILLLTSALIALAFRYWMVVIWRVILHALGSGRKLPPFGVMGHVYAQAWMARYVPGTVTMIAGKIFMASKYGISKTKLAVSSLLEGAMQIIAMSAVSLLLLGFSSHVHNIPASIKIIAITASLVLMIILIPSVFNRLMERLYTLIKKKKSTHEELHINGKAVVRSFVLFAIGTFLSGTANFLLIQAVLPHISFELFGYIVGAFGLAGAVGMAVPFVPSGLGVRDGVQLVFLLAIMSRGDALLIVVLTRIWQVAIDAAFLGIAALIYRIRRQYYNQVISQLSAE